jgi:TRAP-type C4-dicarboxylate transport system permease small subunit
MATGASTHGLLQHLQKSLTRVASVGMLLLMLVTVVDVFLRFLFNSPLRGSYELVECLLVVVITFGMPATFLKRQNIAIDIIDTFLPPAAVRALIRLSDALTVICLVFVTWTMITPALQAYNYGDRKLDLQLPLYVLWIVAFVGMAGAIACALGAAFGSAGGRREGPKS